jgi:putative hydrolase of HD superfamily
MPAVIKTLVELERLKRLERTGWTLRGLPNATESVAAHSFGVGVTAMLLADLFVSRGIDLDVQKVLRIALLHDWAEVRVGDMPKTAAEYFGKEVRKKAETAAFSDVVSELSQAESYRALYDDYEQRKSIEARLVKVADVVDLLVEALALERAGHRGLNEFWEVLEKRDFQLDGLARQLVDEVLDSLVIARSELQKTSSGGNE